MLDYLNNMNTKKKLEDYIKFIKNFEDAIKKENNIPTNENIWSYMTDKFVDYGTADSYKFTRHGSGFSIKKDMIVCEYDKAPLNDYDIKFSYWKFKNFIESNYKEIIIDNILKKDLSDMIDENIISWLIIDGVNWNIYQTKFE